MSSQDFRSIIGRLRISIGPFDLGTFDKTRLQKIDTETMIATSLPSIRLSRALYHPLLLP